MNVWAKLTALVEWGQMPRWKWIMGHVLIGWGAFSVAVTGPYLLGRLPMPGAAIDVFVPFWIGALVATALAVYLEQHQFQHGNVGDAVNDFITYVAIPWVVAITETQGIIGGALVLLLFSLAFVLTLHWVSP